MLQLIIDILCKAIELATVIVGAAVAWYTANRQAATA